MPSYFVRRVLSGALIASLASLPLLLIAPTHAAPLGTVTTFTDRASFTAAASGLTTINFNDQATGNVRNYGGTVTLSGITFTSNASLFAIKPAYSEGYDLSDGTVLSFQGANPNSNMLTVTMPSGITAFGIDFGGFSASNYTFGVAGTTYTFGSSTTPTTAPAFAGFTSSAPINSFTITSAETDAGVVDRFVFGTASPTANAAAPEPGSIALLLTAGVPVVGIIRRRKLSTSQKCQKK